MVGGLGEWDACQKSIVRMLGKGRPRGKGHAGSPECIILYRAVRRSPAKCVGEIRIKVHRSMPTDACHRVHRTHIARVGLIVRFIPAPSLSAAASWPPVSLSRHRFTENVTGQS